MELEPGSYFVPLVIHVNPMADQIPLAGSARSAKAPNYPPSSVPEFGQAKIYHTRTWSIRANFSRILASKVFGTTAVGHPMAERRSIYNAKGVQLGYLEDNVAFDLSGRQRCNYNGASGNLFDSNSERVIGHISLDGTFVGASWISDDLFGKPTGEARPNRPTGTLGANHHRKRATATRSEPLPASSELEQSVDQRSPNAPLASQSDGEQEIDVSSSEISNREVAQPLGDDRASAPEPSDAATSSLPPNELLSRAIGMIRDALVKEQQ